MQKEKRKNKKMEIWKIIGLVLLFIGGFAAFFGALTAGSFSESSSLSRQQIERRRYKKKRCWRYYK